LGERGEIVDDLACRLKTALRIGGGTGEGEKYQYEGPKGKSKTKTDGYKGNPTNMKIGGRERKVTSPSKGLRGVGEAILTEKRGH